MENTSSVTAAAAAAAAPIFRLPNDVLLLIIDAIFDATRVPLELPDDQFASATLCTDSRLARLCRTCRRFHELGHKKLYEVVHITRENGKLVRRTFRENPELAALVKREWLDPAVANAVELEDLLAKHFPEEC